MNVTFEADLFNSSKRDSKRKCKIVFGYAISNLFLFLSNLLFVFLVSVFFSGFNHIEDHYRSCTSWIIYEFWCSFTDLFLRHADKKKWKTIFFDLHWLFVLNKEEVWKKPIIQHDCSRVASISQQRHTTHKVCIKFE